MSGLKRLSEIICLYVTREQAEQILVWYDELPAFTNDHKQAELATTIERAIENHDNRANGLVSPAQTDTCDHWVGVRGSGHYRYGSNTPLAYWTHDYCPKCGEKL